MGERITSRRIGSTQTGRLNENLFVERKQVERVIAFRPNDPSRGRFEHSGRDDNEGEVLS